MCGPRIASPAKTCLATHLRMRSLKLTTEAAIARQKRRVAALEVARTVSLSRPALGCEIVVKRFVFVMFRLWRVLGIARGL